MTSKAQKRIEGRGFNDIEVPSLIEDRRLGYEEDKIERDVGGTGRGG